MMFAVVVKAKLVDADTGTKTLPNPEVEKVSVVEPERTPAPSTVPEVENAGEEEPASLPEPVTAPDVENATVAVPEIWLTVPVARSPASAAPPHQANVILRYFAYRCVKCPICSSKLCNSHVPSVDENKCWGDKNLSLDAL